jgi:hypothetical protein
MLFNKSYVSSPDVLKYSAIAAASASVIDAVKGRINLV